MVYEGTSESLRAAMVELAKNLTAEAFPSDHMRTTYRHRRLHSPGGEGIRRN